MSQPRPPSHHVGITDHYNTLHPVDLSICTFHGQAVQPDYLSDTPNRIGSEWIVNRFRSGTPLELWRTPQGIWLIVDRATAEGVVLNDAQFGDLRPAPAVPPSTTTTPPEEPEPPSTTTTPPPALPPPAGGSPIINIVGNTGNINLALASPNANIKMESPGNVWSKLWKKVKGWWAWLMAKFFAPTPTP